MNAYVINRVITTEFVSIQLVATNVNVIKASSDEIVISQKKMSATSSLIIRVKTRENVLQTQIRFDFFT